MLSCRGEDSQTAQKWRVGASTGASVTDLLLGDSGGLRGGGPLTPRLFRQSVSGSLEYRLNSRWTLAGAVGASLNGTLDLGSESHTLDPGWLAVVSASRSLDDMAPYFVIMGMSLGVSSVPTTSPLGVRNGQLTAGDARFNITVGRLFLDAVAPYALLRVFGGPIIWERDDQPLVGGTDRYHVQAGLGLLLASTTGLDGFIEFAPVGERAITAGLGIGF